jgi:hypothetical protein
MTMAETKWTPGPWTVAREGDTVKVMAPPHFPEWDRVEIADLSFGDTLSRRGANAALVAAAPDLYGALGALVREQENYLTDDATDIALAAARAALARARGEG